MQFHFLLRSCVLLLFLSSTIGSHICRFLGYEVYLQACSCNEMGFPLFFNNTPCRLGRVGRDRIWRTHIVQLIASICIFSRQNSELTVLPALEKEAPEVGFRGFRHWRHHRWLSSCSLVRPAEQKSRAQRETLLQTGTPG